MEHSSESAVALPSNRSFGLVFSLVFAVVGLFPLLKGGEVRVWALITGTAFLVTALTLADILTLPNRLWMQFGALLHRIVSPLILGLLFFVVLTPYALLMRLGGRDSLKLRLDPAAASYWVQRAPPGPPPESLNNQF